MKNIILIRHGQTDSSLHNRLCGSKTDEPLNKTGINQIKNLIPILKDSKITSIYVSPLLRAKQSGKIICEYYSEIKLVEIDDLKEINFGNGEGITFKDLKEQKPVDLLKWLNKPDIFTPPNGESIIELISRVKSVLINLLALKDENLCIITHGGPIRAIIIQTLDIPPKNYWRLKIPHGSATKLEFSNEYFNIHYIWD